MRFLAPALALALLPAGLSAQQKYVAPTDPLSPADERKAFTVPAGFEVQLVAAEPDIQKPIQTAFDARGRLWVTTSHHYPFAGPKGKGTDKLFVLSDFGPDGKAGKVVTFADTLNIPIGILPLPDCDSCIVSSVGEILKLTDTDGDGKADKTEVLFDGFGTKDTHGMYNSFTLMPDGWVYACHGFSNDSTVKGRDGHAVHMNSGNTFRFRPDGSRIEAYTRGQVNPFGIAVDPWLNLYTADCHSMPITQLIPGATYQSFSKPHDGLGFAPHVTRHDHGSTALCGLTWYDADQFPAKYKGCMFLGNVVTNRINIDRIEWHGSTPVAKELPDFLTSADPWFRPADVKLGPDGALYVTDFYNKIIGHYEVDLKHPGRDKDRGRVWRVVWKGEPGASATGGPPKMPFTDLTRESADGLAKLAQHPDLTVRLLVAAQLRARFPDQLKALYPAKTQADALRDLPDAAHPRAQRAAVQYAGMHPHPDFVKPLVEVIEKCPSEDTHLKYAARVALRNSLRENDPAAAWKAAGGLPPAAAAVVADVALAVPDGRAADYLAQQIKSGAASEDRLAAFAEHIGRHGNGGERTVVIERAAKWKGGGVKALAMLDALIRGIQTRAGDRLDGENGDRVLARARDELVNGLPATRLASLKLLADLPPVLSDYRFRDNPEIDPTPVVAKLVADPRQPDALRGAALETYTRFDAKRGYASAEALIDDPRTSPAVREKAALVLAASADRNHKSAAKDAIKSVPYKSGVAIATALAGSAVGAEILLGAVKEGKAPAHLLQEKGLLTRIRAANVPDLDKRVVELTKGLQPADQKLAALLKQRAARFVKATPDKTLGAKLFTQHCAACHQIGGQGGKVGPNLDGVGVRGHERLLEDVLDPNRNVDAAFRARVLTLADGTTKTGLMLRVEGGVVVMADAEGKEYRVPTQDIESNRETALSPMPANFGDTLPEAEFYHLLAYLLDQRAKDPPPKK